jgi:hypothetical protein
MAADPRTNRLRCFFLAATLAWAVAIFLSSALIAFAGLSPLTPGKSAPHAVWAVADEVAPFAKIGFILVLAPLLWAVDRRLRAPWATVANMAAGCAAMLLTLLFLPQSYSRGFGIGLTGMRLDAVPLAIYLVSGAVSGLAFGASHANCRRRIGPNVTE